MKDLNKKTGRIIIRKCHLCGVVQETVSEAEKCTSCKRSYLPLHYFSKVHNCRNQSEFSELFSDASELSEEDLIKGIYVLW